MEKENDIRLASMISKLVQNALEEKYNRIKRDYLFTISQIAKKVKMTPQYVREQIILLEKEGLVERTDITTSWITWRTRFGKHGKSS
ncbi:MAG: hypothetical protein IMZ53_15675 [Thermoplasmata archaeon]|nr:hypothetical protein [Thermoplasmata archaeon]MBE3142013.1 hypothetical protein [Thermoplasmata archaeon]